LITRSQLRVKDRSGRMNCGVKATDPGLLRRKAFGFVVERCARPVKKRCQACHGLAFSQRWATIVSVPASRRRLPALLPVAIGHEASISVQCANTVSGALVELGMIGDDDGFPAARFTIAP